MFQYHQTNGERGEICVARAGNFIGFIVNLGRADRWAAYTRQLELIGDRADLEVVLRHMATDYDRGDLNLD
jgi:hypothetical protein